MVIMITIKTDMAMRIKAVAAPAATTLILEVFSFRLSLDPLP